MRIAALTATTVILVGIYLAVAAMLALEPILVAAGLAAVAALGAITAVVTGADAGTA